MKKKFFDILAEVCEDVVVKTNPDVELFETGLLDSAAFLKMLIRIEDEFGMEISATELDRECVNTPNKFYDIFSERIVR